MTHYQLHISATQENLQLLTEQKVFNSMCMFQVCRVKKELVMSLNCILNLQQNLHVMFTRHHFTVMLY